MELLLVWVWLYVGSGQSTHALHVHTCQRHPWPKIQFLTFCSKQALQQKLSSIVKWSNLIHLFFVRKRTIFNRARWIYIIEIGYFHECNSLGTHYISYTYRCFFFIKEKSVPKTLWTRQIDNIDIARYNRISLKKCIAEICVSTWCSMIPK